MHYKKLQWYKQFGKYDTEENYLKAKMAHRKWLQDSTLEKTVEILKDPYKARFIDFEQARDLANSVKLKSMLDELLRKQILRNQATGNSI